MDLDELEMFIGIELKNIFLTTDQKLVCFEFDTSCVYYKAVADCCADCWIEHINLPGISENKKNYGKLLAVRQNETISEEVDTDDLNQSQLDITVYEIDTESGSIQIETRTNHNGYYSGSLVLFRMSPMLTFKQVKESF